MRDNVGSRKIVVAHSDRTIQCTKQLHRLWIFSVTYYLRFCNATNYQSEIQIVLAKIEWIVRTLENINNFTW